MPGGGGLLRGRALGIPLREGELSQLTRKAQGLDTRVCRCLPPARDGGQSLAGVLLEVGPPDGAVTICSDSKEGRNRSLASRGQEVLLSPSDGMAAAEHRRSAV